MHVIAAASGPVTPVGIEQRVSGWTRFALAVAVGVGPRGTQQVVRRRARPGIAAGTVGRPLLAARH